MAYQKVEQFEGKITSGLIENYRESLSLLGEDPEREGLLKTPERVAKAMQYMTQGYQIDARAILESAKFHEEVSEMIIVKDIELYSLCEHHMLPFYGKAHVAYIPNGFITGLSKIARVVDVYARRLQVQERLTAEIAAAIESALGPRGVGVLVSAEHLCLAARGASRPGVLMTTEALRGSLRDDAATRSQLARSHERGLARRGGHHG